MTIVLLRIFFAKRETSGACDSHSFLLSSDPSEMSLNIDMKMIRPFNFSGVTLNLDSNSWTVAELQRVESLEDMPLEFNWLIIFSVQSSVFR